MIRYICTLRRGTKETDESGTVIRDDWAQYTAEKPEEAIPREGELVLEYDNGIPRLKIGNGVSTFAELEYISVDSFILPKPVSVTLYANKWEPCEGVDFRWHQVVTVTNGKITPNSKVDLQPTPDDLVEFHDLDLAFVTENDNGVVTVFCVGQKPTKDYIIPATITEVILNG